MVRWDAALEIGEIRHTDRVRADGSDNAKPPILLMHGVFGRPSLLEP